MIDKLQQVQWDPMEVSNSLASYILFYPALTQLLANLHNPMAATFQIVLLGPSESDRSSGSREPLSKSSVSHIGELSRSGSFIVQNARFHSTTI